MHTIEANGKPKATATEISFVCRITEVERRERERGGGEKREGEG